MGLDMYLYAKQFVASSDWESEDNRKKVKSIARLMKGTKFLFDDLQFAEVKLQIAYWRKANHIHKYFIDKCAGGKDECQNMHVDVDHLKDLLNRCETVLKDKSKARELLPTQSGFFFGGTDYDQWYYEDIEDTIPTLQKILKNAQDTWEFEYRASW